MSIRRAALLLVVALAAAPVRAQGSFAAEIQVHLPAVLPPLVVIEPGVRAVSRVDQDVFFVDRFYWVRRGPAWYRARDHRGTWVYVGPEGVPQVLARLPPAQYRRHGGDDWKDEQRARKRARKARHAEWKEERKEWKEEEKADRKADHAWKKRWKKGKERGQDEFEVE